MRSQYVVELVSVALMSLMAKNSRPCALQHRMLNPCIVSSLAPRPVTFRVGCLRGEEVDHVRAAVGRASSCRVAPGRRFDHDGAGHVWMQRAEILIGAGRREREREFVPRIERLRLEELAARGDGVR